MESSQYCPTCLLLFSKCLGERRAEFLAELENQTSRYAPTEVHQDFQRLSAQYPGQTRKSASRFSTLKPSMNIDVLTWCRNVLSQKSLDFNEGKNVLCRKCVKGSGVLSEKNTNHCKRSLEECMWKRTTEILLQICTGGR